MQKKDSARRFLVVTSDTPFVRGGHRVIAKELARAIRRGGHEAEVLRTPQNRFGRQFSACLANWSTDVSETGNGDLVERVISLRYPSYAVRHRSHVCWLNHRMREYYDLWPAFRRKLSRKGCVKEQVIQKALLLHMKLCCFLLFCVVIGPFNGRSGKLAPRSRSFREDFVNFSPFSDVFELLHFI